MLVAVGVSVASGLSKVRVLEIVTDLRSLNAEMSLKPIVALLLQAVVMRGDTKILMSWQASLRDRSLGTWTGALANCNKKHHASTTMSRSENLGISAPVQASVLGFRSVE